MSGIQEFFQRKDAVGYGEPLLKFVICMDQRDRKRVLYDLGESSEKGDDYEIFDGKFNYTLGVTDKALRVNFEIRTLSTIQHDWKDHLRGYQLNEVLFTDRSLKFTSKEDIDMVATRCQSLTGDSVKDCALSLMTLGSRRAGYLSSMLDIDHGSAFKSINFPVSLFRRQMLQYFEKPMEPTHQEFLMALMLEGVHASTPEEKAAVEQANLYV